MGKGRQLQEVHTSDRCRSGQRKMHDVAGCPAHATQHSEDCATRSSGRAFLVDARKDAKTGGNKCDRERFVREPYLGCHWLVDRTPPNVGRRAILLHDAFVQGRSTRLGPRISGQSSGRGDGRTSLVHQCILVKCCNGRVRNLRVSEYSKLADCIEVP